jgi:hypothetical protein
MFDIVTHVALRCFIALTHPRPAAPQQRAARDSGQATTEYALVLLGAAAIALLIITWATAGGGAGRIGSLFDLVIDAITGKL